MKTKRKVAPLAATLITIGSLAGGAMAQTTLAGGYFSSQGITDGMSINGTYDISSETGISGLTMTIAGDAIYKQSPFGILINQSGDLAITFNQTISFSGLNIGSFLAAGELNGWSSGGVLTNTDISSPPIVITSNSIQNTSATSYNNPSLYNIDWTSTDGFKFGVSNPANNDTYFSIDVPAVPEPSSAVLLGLGGLGLMLRRHR